MRKKRSERNETGEAKKLPPRCCVQQHLTDFLRLATSSFQLSAAAVEFPNEVGHQNTPSPAPWVQL